MTSVPRPTSIKARDVLFGLSFLAAAAALTIFMPERAEFGQRILGVMAGVFVMYYANAIPKALKPLAKLRNPARYEALQRFIGWCLVLGGLGYALAWIVVPFAYVLPVAMTLLGGSLALAVGRCFRVRRLA